MRMTLAAITLIVAAAAAPLGGCMSFGAHPPLGQEKTIPSHEPFPTLMAASIRHVHDTCWNESDSFAYNLPVGTTKMAYRKVGEQLQRGYPLENPGDPAIHVVSVRTLADKAEVDVIVPRQGVLEMITVYFKSDLADGWHITGDRLWRIPQTAPAPTYAIAE